jgi:hypothetical protein
MITGAAKIARAIQLRDAALDLIKRSKQRPSKGIVSFDGDGFHGIYRTLFFRLPATTDRFKYSAALHGRTLHRGSINLPYGLDIWQCGGRKVLNIEWDEKGIVELVSYKPGDWEAALLPLS